jgi:hypothetical protein
MTQKFALTRGFVRQERDKLFVSIKNPALTRTLFYDLLLLLVPVVFVLHLYDNEEQDGRWHFRVLVYGVMTLLVLPQLYRALFRKSYASRIQLRHICSFRVEPDLNDLDVHVHLLLRSGRERTLTFRKREADLELFTQYLSETLAQPQLS